MKYLILLLLSFNCLAQQEINVSYLRINENLFDTIAFKMDAVQASYSYIHETGLGIRLDVARGVETANSLYVEGLLYQDKINALFGGSVIYRYDINDKYSFDVGVGKVDYHSTWKVNGVEPEWSKGTDSDWAYHANVHYHLEGDAYLTFGYSDIYRKHKENYGRETTRYFKVGFSYRF